MIIWCCGHYLPMGILMTHITYVVTIIVSHRLILRLNISDSLSKQGPWVSMCSHCGLPHIQYTVYIMCMKGVCIIIHYVYMYICVYVCMYIYIYIYMYMVPMLLCFVVFRTATQYAPTDFVHILQGCFTSTGAIRYLIAPVLVKQPWRIWVDEPSGSDKN